MSNFLDDLKRTVKRLAGEGQPGSKERETPAEPDSSTVDEHEPTSGQHGQQSEPLRTDIPTGSEPPTPAPADEGGVRMVYCAKLKRRLPGLDEPPFPGEFGQRIYENISRQAYQMWIEQSTIIINHYGLSLGDPDARAFLQEQMEFFLFQDTEEHTPEGWIPEDEQAAGPPPVPGPQGKGGGAPGPQGKGGGAPGPMGKGGGPAGPQAKG